MTSVDGFYGEHGEVRVVDRQEARAIADRLERRRHPHTSTIVDLNGVPHRAADPDLVRAMAVTVLTDAAAARRSP